MKKVIIPVLFSAMLFLQVTAAPVQEEEVILRPKISLSLRPFLSAEFFSRSILWEGESLLNPVREDDTTRLKTFLFSLGLKVRFGDKLFAAPFVGYSLSNFDPLAFRELPFSVSLSTGYKDGLVLGAVLGGDFFSFGRFALGARGLFLTCLGLKKTLNITSLNTDGTLEGNPNWTVCNAGPVLTYKGIQYLYPFAGLSYDRAWGKYKIEQTIGLLSAEETRKFKSEGMLSAVLGVLYEMTDFFHVSGELKMMPYGGGVDFSLLLKASYVH